jgi:Neuraminidase (sialidase)
MKIAHILSAFLIAAALPAAAETSWKNPVSTSTLATSATAEFQVLSHGGEAGPYAAFPDVARLQNGDIMAVFYSGYTHVSLPKPGWEKGGRICTVRSSDEGRTWTKPAILFDDERDNRDPHIAQLADGTMIVSFFSLMPRPDAKSSEDRASSGTEIILSHDGGKTWTAPHVIASGWYVSAPVRQLKDGTCLLGIYHADPKTKEHLGGVLISKDNGETWSQPHEIGKGQNLPIDAETDVIELKDGRIFAALRSSDKTLHYAYSTDKGETWQPAVDSGFRGHAPHLNRLSTGEIIMAHRLPDTSIHVSRDDTKTWDGPYIIDNVFGAYPSTVELKDGTVLIVYYTEGNGSQIRAKRFKLTANGPAFMSVTIP